MTNLKPYTTQSPLKRPKRKSVLKTSCGKKKERAGNHDFLLLIQNDFLIVYR